MWVRFLTMTHCPLEQLMHLTSFGENKSESKVYSVYDLRPCMGYPCLRCYTGYANLVVVSIRVWVRYPTMTHCPLEQLMHLTSFGENKSESKVYSVHDLRPCMGYPCLRCYTGYDNLVVVSRRVWVRYPTLTHCPLEQLMHLTSFGKKK